ncbi:MAG: ArnT family glycosyltransferase [Planctomycetota bacterium]|jgi:hypothetical protein
MSKPARKRTLPKRHARPQKRESTLPDTLQRNKKYIVLAIVAILAAIPFTLGKHFEFNSPDPYDSGSYVYSAKHILDGAVIGVDERPSAQLGTLLVNMLGVWFFGFNETGPNLIQGILQAAALVLMFIALRKLFGTLPAAVSVIVTSIYLSAPLIAKFGNVKEQHMIAFMIMAMSCFVLRQLGGRWWWAVLAGAFVIWAPLFKQTGVSAMAAIGLFVLIQPLFRHRSWKKTASDIVLLAAGAVIAIAPACVWLLTCHGGRALPYAFVWRPIVSSFRSSPQEPEPNPAESDDDAVQNTSTKQGLLMKLLPAYVRDSWQILKPEQKRQAKLRVLRWYWLLILPIVLATGAIAVRIVRLIRRTAPAGKAGKINYDRFVFLFAVWWLLDMAFVWISPRSYEQYYLPLNASAAMLGGYFIATYTKLLENPVNKNIWKIVGFIGILFMIGMSWHIFFGIETSPHSNTPYGEKRRGYAQKLKEIANRKRGARGAWEVLGDYIRNNSTESNNIYVWGWVPGIYVQAQRLSSVPNAFEGTMHTMSPAALSKRVEAILSAFEKEPPMFIVDTHKVHFPWDRPPLELWPTTGKGLLPNDEATVARFDMMYSKLLREKINPAQKRMYEQLTRWGINRLMDMADPDEALRYEAMKPFRQYVMKNYKIVAQPFGQNLLFERK